MKNFRRRIYSVSGFFHDIFTVIKNPVLALRAMWGNSISSPFRQRLMLAVTAVNGCRYCTYLRTKEALRAGLSQQEIQYLLGGNFENVPVYEIKAILYAQHWADNNGNPDPDTQADFIDAYGAEKTRVITMALLLIRIGNLTGNSFDYALFRMTDGQWGLSEQDRS